MSWTQVERDTGKAWWVAAGCAIASTFGLMSFLVGAIPTLAVEIERDTGWARGAIMGSIGVVVLIGALLGPYVGRLIDQQGARRWIMWSQFGSGLGLIAMSVVGTSLWAFYAAVAFAGIMTVGASPVSYGKVLVPWFDNKRGIALGLSAIGVGIAAIILPLVTASLALQIGWQNSLALYGVLAIILAIPVQWFFVRDFPHSINKSLGHITDPADGFIKVFRESWRQHTHFRLIILMFVIMGMAHAGIVLNLVPMQEDGGMSKSLAAGTQSVLGITLIIGRILGGFLFDIFKSPRPLLAGVVPAMIGIAMLGFVSDVWLVYLAAGLIGLGSGIENDGIPYLISRYFPPEHFAKLSAAVQSTSSLALAFGPAMVAATRDATGDYMLACMISSSLLAFVCVMVLMLPSFNERVNPISPKITA
jgi:MFS family permease